MLMKYLPSGVNIALEVVAATLVRQPSAEAAGVNVDLLAGQIQTGKSISPLLPTWKVLKKGVEAYSYEMNSYATR